MVPILSIVLDSPAFKRVLEARQDTSKMDALVNRLQTLEDEMATLERVSRDCARRTSSCSACSRTPTAPATPPKA